MNLFSKYTETSIPNIKKIYINYGLEKTIPNFIYDKMGVKVKYSELKAKRKISTIYCNRCGKLK